MKFMKERPEDILLYADTVLNQVLANDHCVKIDAEGFDQSRITLQFTEATIIKSTNDYPGLVGDSQIVKIINGMHRIILYDDKKEIIFEIEYLNCKRI